MHICRAGALWRAYPSARAIASGAASGHADSNMDGESYGSCYGDACDAARGLRRGHALPQETSGDR